MKAIFRGGPLDGRQFTVGEPPPRGLDVEHEGRVLRYGCEGMADTGESRYGFVSKRWAFNRGATWVFLGDDLRAAALPFYPTIPQSNDSSLGF